MSRKRLTNVIVAVIVICALAVAFLSATIRASAESAHKSSQSNQHNRIAGTKSWVKGRSIVCGSPKFQPHPNPPLNGEGARNPPSCGRG